MKMNRRDFLKLLGATAGTVALTPFMGTISALKPEPEPEQETIRKWAIRWTQWAFSYTDNESPLLDETGEQVQRSQPDKEHKMILLSGGYMDEEKIRRSIIIPHTASIFYPVIMGTWGYNDVGTYFTSEQEMISTVKKEIDSTSLLQTTLDGKPVPYVREDSGEIFYTYYAESKHERTKQGVNAVFLDGYWTILGPLSKGEHEIYIHGRLEREGLTHKPYENEVTYDIKVE
jgi:hypothetical protein